MTIDARGGSAAEPQNLARRQNSGDIFGKYSGTEISAVGVLKRSQRSQAHCAVPLAAPRWCVLRLPSYVMQIQLSMTLIHSSSTVVILLTITMKILLVLRNNLNCSTCYMPPSYYFWQ